MEGTGIHPSKDEESRAKGATGADRSTTTAALGALLVMEPLQNSISVQTDKAFHHMKKAHKVKFIKDGGPSEFTAEGF